MPTSPLPACLRLFAALAVLVFQLACLGAHDAAAPGR